MTKFAPGEVTPEQLEEYRKRMERAQRRERNAFALIVQLIEAHGEMMAACEDATLVYVWAQQGMVRQP